MPLSEPTKIVPSATEGDDSTPLDAAVRQTSTPDDWEMASMEPEVVPNTTRPSVTATVESTGLPAAKVQRGSLFWTSSAVTVPALLPT